MNSIYPKRLAGILSALLLALFARAGSPEGEGTQQAPYRIESVGHLMWIAEHVNQGIELAGLYFIQTADIDFAPHNASFGESGWDPIGGYRYVDGILQKVGFAGHYDGQNYRILNLKINRKSENYQGLFGYVKGSIRRLTLEHAEIYGQEYVAALTGYLFDETISDCQVLNSTVHATAFYAAALCGYQAWGAIRQCSVTNCDVAGVDYVGGITGWNNEGEISQCHTSGQIAGTGSLAGGVAGYQYYGSISLAFSTAAVTGGEYAGGLIGKTSHSQVAQCFATGPVTGTSNVGGLLGRNESTAVSDCFATGPVSGSEFVGGLAGYNTYSEGTFTNCYATGKVEADSPYVGGFLGGITGGSLSGCFWDTGTSGHENGIGGIPPEEGVECTGKSTSEMKTATTYTSWDFQQIWGIQPSVNNGYPHLQALQDELSSISLPEDAGIRISLSDRQVFLTADRPMEQIRLYSLSGLLLTDWPIDRELSAGFRIPENIRERILILHIRFADQHSHSRKLLLP